VDLCAKSYAWAPPLATPAGGGIWQSVACQDPANYLAAIWSEHLRHPLNLVQDLLLQDQTGEKFAEDQAVHEDEVDGQEVAHKDCENEEEGKVHEAHVPQAFCAQNDVLQQGF
jgi:hypothetical protein